MNEKERKSRPKLKCETHSIRRKNLQNVKPQILGFPQQELAKEFSKNTGRFIPGRILAAALENRRKEGLLPTLTPPPAEPFGDINDIAV